jgi:hypothetical protein
LTAQWQQRRRRVKKFIHLILFLGYRALVSRVILRKI